ncbi:hypothetical protein BU24DRAFT_477254 [Aaosphaeria arxii CBS 175.79]|uniref:Zinc finger PHD-type domain-containing protein n=1 Tax=Aaosphaeria arxii CBS 175.79 TaxID=1450172 RepID=A0A6A5Y3J2_9PLEO|nr:uncharacterized protein BU24DRAFT_477254 [Aaosphaeria arxii CBS 175.79]KAF2020115.1 hypothetical protein BU24DRAFT_477254 [Aaosphaeria arxii CBS 175.79]
MSSKQSKESYDLFRWEDHNNLNHHCGRCQKPLSRDNARVVCFGHHVEPCSRFHQVMFLLGRTRSCTYCKDIDEDHHQKHLGIAGKLRQIYEMLGLDTFIIPPDVVQAQQRRPSGETREQEDDKPTDKTKGLSLRPTKKERKEIKKREKAALRPKVVTQDEIEYLGVVLHGTADGPVCLNDPTSPGEADDMEKLLAEKAKAYNESGRRGSRRLSDAVLTGAFDFGVEVERILGDLKLPNGRPKNKGHSGKEQKAFDEEILNLKEAIVDDLLYLKGVQLHTSMRRAAFLRYTNRTSNDIISARHEDWDWKTGERRERPLAKSKKGKEREDEPSGSNATADNELDTAYDSDTQTDADDSRMLSPDHPSLFEGPVEPIRSSEDVLPGHVDLTEANATESSQPSSFSSEERKSSCDASSRSRELLSTPTGSRRSRQGKNRKKERSSKAGSSDLGGNPDTTSYRMSYQELSNAQEEIARGPILPPPAIKFSSLSHKFPSIWGAWADTFDPQGPAFNDEQAGVVDGEEDENDDSSDSTIKPDEDDSSSASTIKPDDDATTPATTNRTQGDTDFMYYVTYPSKQNRWKLGPFTREQAIHHVVVVEEKQQRIGERLMYIDRDLYHWLEHGDKTVFPRLNWEVDHVELDNRHPDLLVVQIEEYQHRRGFNDKCFSYVPTKTEVELILEKDAAERLAFKELASQKPNMCTCETPIPFKYLTWEDTIDEDAARLDCNLKECMNKNCVGKFFHLHCVEDVPSEEGSPWLCPPCRRVESEEEVESASDEFVV